MWYVKTPTRKFFSVPADTANGGIRPLSPWKKVAIVCLALIAAVYFHRVGSQASGDTTSPECYSEMNCVILKVGGFRAELQWPRR